MAPRRSFLSRIALLPLAPLRGFAAQKTARPVLKILMKSAWGSDDPTKSAFPFLHGLALAEAGQMDAGALNSAGRTPRQSRIASVTDTPRAAPESAP